MVGRPAQTLVAVGIALAGMAVLVAAGRQSPPAPLQPTDPGEVVPAALSRQVFSTWARANLDAQHSVDALGHRLDRCARRSHDPGSQEICRGRVLDDFQSRVGVALERARMLFPAGGPCGRSLRIYAEQLKVYSSAVRWYDQGTTVRPYSETGLIGLRQRSHLAGSVVFEACSAVL